MQAMRRQSQDARECAGGDRDHQQQNDAKAACSSRLSSESWRALVGAKRKLLTVMIDEGSLERLTVGVQRAVERHRAFRSVDRHRDPLAAKGEHTDRQRVPALHRRSTGKLLAAGNTPSPARLQLLYVTPV
jgi:hypothetical protein